MRPFYLAAVFGTRLISVLSVLLLSHIMSRQAFGEFTLINTNALLIQMVLGSWLVSIANRALVNDQDSVDEAMMAAISCAMLLMIAVALVTGLLYVTFNAGQAGQILATVSLASLFMGYDVTLAVKNAVGREAIYASFALSRNLLVLAISAGLVFAGAGVLGPVTGLAIGTALPIIMIPSIRRMWSDVRPSWRSLKRLNTHIGFGVGGGFLLGVYILVNAPTRNIFAYHLGEAATGVWSLCSDLMYGPLAVVGNGYALSQIRLIYLAVAAGNDELLARRTRELFEFTLAIAMPYAVGGYVFASDLMGLVLPEKQVLAAKSIAAPAAIQSALILVLYSLATIALARGRFVVVILMVISTACAAALPCAFGRSAADMASLATGGTSAAVLFWASWSSASGLVRLRPREMGKLILSVAILGSLAKLAQTLLDIPGGWILAALVGSAAFICVAVWLKLEGFGAVLPKAVRERFFGPSRCELS